MDTKKYELIVVGGGFAGTCAAIAAARQGVKTLLIEQSNALGGAAITCLVNPFMPYTTLVNGEDKYLSRGIFEEIAEVIDPAINGKRGECEPFDEETLKILLQRKCLEAGVELLFHAYLHAVDAKNGKINTVTVGTVAGDLTFAADYFIDATGDANLSMLAGCKFRLGREKDSLCQPMTLCFRLCNVNVKEAMDHYAESNEKYIKAREAGEIKNPRENLLIFRTVHDGILHFNSTRIVKLNPTDPFDVTRAEIEAREQVYELVDFLKKNAKGYENCELLSTALRIGARESRMIDGEHILNAEELKDCTRFEDSVALGNYDIDIHNPEGTGTSHYYFPAGQYYTIPYRILVPKGMKNLLTAGRCSSATHEAQASIRIMPIVATLGEAAGDAIAVAKEMGNAEVGKIDIGKLHGIFDKTNVAYR